MLTITRTKSTEHAHTLWIKDDAEEDRRGYMVSVWREGVPLNRGALGRVQVHATLASAGKGTRDDMRWLGSDVSLRRPQYANRVARVMALALRSVKEIESAEADMRATMAEMPPATDSRWS
jgi:hypothetical protein